MKFLILLLCLFPYVFSITIRDASVQGDGSDEDNPVEEGEELVLQCTTDSDWSSCAWEHEIEDQLVKSDVLLAKMFGSTHLTENKLISVF